MQALDKAIASVTWDEYTRLKERGPDNVADNIQSAFRSIDKLQSRRMPAYDEWDALLYVSWYQARQVHLICTALQQYPPPPSSKPLQVIDIGCGTWAAPIALAILATEDHAALRDRQVSVHGIEPSEAMTRLGEELCLEFWRVAEEQGLPIDFIDEMINNHCILSSVKEMPSDAVTYESSECWLLVIHALYDQSKSGIRRFLCDYRRQHETRIRYELLTTHKGKMDELGDLIVKGAGKWIGPQSPSSLPPMKTGHLKPIWNGNLPDTTEHRRCIRANLAESDTQISDKYMNYLNNPVSWNPSNKIEADTVWIRQIHREKSATPMDLPDVTLRHGV